MYIKQIIQKTQYEWTKYKQQQIKKYQLYLDSCNS